jgi:Rel/ankyrin family protein
MLAISDPEVQLPTLTMNSDQLAGLGNYDPGCSLSNIIQECGMYMQPPEAQPPAGTITVEAGTVPGQDQGFTIQLVNPGQQQQQQQAPRDMLDNIRGFPQQQQQQEQQQDFMQLLTSQPPCPSTKPSQPYVEILEQPASHKLRFRYECEGRGAGALQGATSTTERKTFPKIRIVGYNGPAVVVVSCVTHDSDKPKAHPHMLVSPASVGRDGCKKGVCTSHVNSPDMTVEFQHLGIQCKRKKDIQKALDERKSIRVDPYRQGFDHSNSPGNIDLNAVKLCFQAFLEDPATPGKFTRVVPPVCSKPIFDAKAKKELQIMDISDTSAPAEGGKKIIILCERVSRDDIKVKFFHEGWEAFGEFKPEDVHKQYAISLNTPPYKDTHLTEPKQVWVELRKQDGSTSEPTEFFFTPSNSSAGGPKHVELARRPEVVHVQQKPVNMYNGGSVTNIKSERSIKVERTENGSSSEWAAMIDGVAPAQGNRPVVTPYSQVVPNSGGGLVLGSNVQFTSPQSNSELADLNQVLASQGNYVDYNPQYSPYSADSQSSYDNNITQQSPDPQGMSNMNIASPIGIDGDTNIDLLGSEHEMNNLSQELKGMTFVEPLDIAAAQQQQSKSATKRSSRAADNDSASNIIPRQMERQQSNTLHTPNISTTISTGDLKMTSGDLRDLTAVLKNCPEVNQL